MTSVKQKWFLCPCCRLPFRSPVLASWNNLGKLSTDLHQRSAGVQPIWYLSHTCRFCGYSACDCTFRGKKLKKFIKVLIRDKIRPLVKTVCKKGMISPELSYEFAAWIMSWCGESGWVIGKLLLAAAWCCDDFNKKDNEKVLRIETVKWFERAQKGGEVPENDLALCCYLIGENHRRIGNTGMASHFYERAIEASGHDPEKKWIYDLAILQMKQPEELLDSFTMDPLWIAGA